jgi:hypothetical protein
MKELYNIFEAADLIDRSVMELADLTNAGFVEYQEVDEMGKVLYARSEMEKLKETLVKDLKRQNEYEGRFIELRE